MITPFKQCSYCGHKWVSRAEFVDDTDLLLNGYQAHLGDMAEGLLLFTHLRLDCGTTLAVRVADFSDLWAVPTEIQQAKTGSAECPRHCLSIRDLEPCIEACRYRPVRDLLVELKIYKEAPDVQRSRSLFAKRL